MRRRLVHKVFGKLVYTGNGFETYFKFDEQRSEKVQEPFEKPNDKIIPFRAKKIPSSNLSEAEESLNLSFGKLLIGGIGWAYSHWIKCLKILTFNLAKYHKSFYPDFLRLIFGFTGCGLTWIDRPKWVIICVTSSKLGFESLSKTLYNVRRLIPVLDRHAAEGFSLFWRIIFSLPVSMAIIDRNSSKIVGPHLFTIILLKKKKSLSAILF